MPYILVVQSDRELSGRLAELLRSADYEVAAEAEVAWARRMLPVRAPDAVVVDTQLSDATGFALADALRADPDTKNVPIFFTANRFRGAAHRAEARRRYAPAECLDQPVDLDALFARLVSAVPTPGGAPDKPAPKTRSPSAQLPIPVMRNSDATQRKERREVEAAARRIETSTRHMTGSLAQEPFARVLRRIYLGKMTGALLLERDRVKKIVSFHDGYPVAVRSNMLAECLGQILASHNLITPEALQRSVEIMRAQKRQQGQILVELGALSPNGLERALALQVETKLLEIFAWRRGDYVFADGEAPAADTRRLARPPAAIILEGTRRYYDKARQDEALSAFVGQNVAPSRDPLQRLQDMTAEPGEQMFIESLDGSLPLEALLETRLIAPARARLLLVAMAEAGMIEPAAMATAPVDIEIEDFTEPPTGPAPRDYDPPEISAAAMTPAVGTPVYPPHPAAPPTGGTQRAAAPPTGRTPRAAAPPTGRTPRTAAPPPVPMEALPTVPTPPPLAETVVRPYPFAPAATVVVAMPERFDVAPPPVSPRPRSGSRPRISLNDELHALLEAQRAQSHYEALGVSESAGVFEIDRAYDALARQYHPDRFRDGPFERRQVAQQIFDRLSEAQATLSDSARRRRYDGERAIARAAQTPTAQAPAARTPPPVSPAAERMHATGVELLRARRTHEAVEAFRRAVALAPERASYRSALGWAIFRESPADPDAVDAGLAELRLAVHIDPRDPWLRVSLGRFYAETGWPDLAIVELEEALRLRPGLSEIEDEVRRLKGSQ